MVIQINETDIRQKFNGDLDINYVSYKPWEIKIDGYTQ